MTLRLLRAAVETWVPGRGIAVDPVHRIAATWVDIVGHDVAANCEPVELNGTTLLVATRSSAWSQQLQMLSPTILGAISALPGAVDVRRLAFRTGGLRRAGRRGDPAARASTKKAAIARAPSDASLGPAADAAEALARLRRRIESVRRSAREACAACGAPRESHSAGTTCAPCAGGADRDRELSIQRLVYMAPWLGLAELRAELPDLSGSEFERARRLLLHRWWGMLERAKRQESLSRSGLERHVASSYVLLHSRLPPDRITPAIVANLLGDELVRLLWPAPAPPPEPGRRETFVEQNRS